MRPPASARKTGPALEAGYQFIVWLAPTVEKFPRSQKFSLGDRILDTAYDLLERLIEATYTSDRAAYLRAANLDLEKLRILCRLAMDLHHLELRQLEHAARELDRIGRLIGGWAKTDAAQKAAH